MGRIMCLDIGGKRTGVAVTDPLKIIATGLPTIESKELIDFLKKYFLAEAVELLIVGMPKNWDESDTHGTPIVKAAIAKIEKAFPALPLKTVDERFTSSLAKQAMVDMGMKKKDRQKKGNVDEIAAVLMLQEYLQQGS